MSVDKYLEKWNRRHQEAEDEGSPAQVLIRNLHLLPASGKALDLACGRGANALLLAERGLDTHAWDFSTVGIRRLQQTAAQRGLFISTEVRDVLARPPAADSFDVILVSFFLERRLIPHLVQALRPGGRLFYQTFVQDVCLDRGPSSPGWRLANNELLHLFRQLDVHYYREDGRAATVQTEISDLALLVASKRRN
ncbi:class I SAM-dependent methyltransferase [Thiolapillus sp.]